LNLFSLVVIELLGDVLSEEKKKTGELTAHLLYKN
jgi:hypothetical protein